MAHGIPQRPVAQKTPKEPKNPNHLALVAGLPCVICYEFFMRQNSRTEVHHCKSGRFSRAKEADTKTIPLCHSHHNKLRPIPGDEGKIGYHNGQETWEAEYGKDYEWLDWVEEKINSL